MSSSSGTQRGSAVLGMLEGGEMSWDSFVPTVRPGCCQEISSSSLSNHMGAFWGVSVGHPCTLGFAGLQFSPSCGLQWKLARRGLKGDLCMCLRLEIL